MKVLRHNKIKNTGILFELLARQVTSDVLESKNGSPALHIMQKYFNSSTELGRELSLYRAFFETHNLSENKAIDFVNVVINQRSKLNDKKLNEEKYNLIKEIKNTLPVDKFLDGRISQYRTYASIYKVFAAESLNPEELTINIADLTNSKFTIVEHVMGSNKTNDPKETLMEEFRQQSEDLRILTNKIIVDKFNTKYSKLDEIQKTLLGKYINNVSNTTDLREYINLEVPKVQNKLNLLSSKVNDKVTQIKISEVVSQLPSLSRGKTVSDNQVTALMIAYELIKEIKSCLK